MSDNHSNTFGFDEMMVHVPLCTHKEVERLLVVGEVSDKFKAEIAKHKIETIVYSDSLNSDDEFNVVLYTTGTPSSLEMANVHRCLEPKKGIFVCVGDFIYMDIEESKKQLSTVAKDFWICMPFNCGHNTLIFASHKYHPQAEIILQKSDLLPDCEYYNSELQNAAFVYPTYITKAITGIAKR